jgi:iron(II)-dependent oxidoreductase
MNQLNQTQRKREIIHKLKEARERTLYLFASVPDAHLNLRVHDFYSPIGWHFGHVGMTEEYWALTRALGRPPLKPDYTFLFANIPENPKDNRVHLPDRTEIVRYLKQTRRAVLDALETTDLDSEDPLIADGYAWEFAHQHECQHQETIAELLQLLSRHVTSPVLREGMERLAMQNPPPTELISIRGGTFLMGSNDRHGYDNEKCAHEVTVAPFQLEKTPVTSAQWTQFMADGGYERQELWTEAGWAWRQAENARCPEYWQPVREGYGYFYAGGIRGIHPREPVTSLSWYEADAHARWRGLRLPTEAEWEFAAADAGSFGLCNMAGGVWEWTSSPFLPYPGFEAFPYDGYSKDHMDGTHYVCRGGSWASDARILRVSFRNWYVPSYRQGFLGLRCAL